ncbi:MAG: hypothetical protein DHS20C15_31690 [Planctomycetota bacterium]|nr:MAG: hypothetical protein DHS20C15_31690 [Planctomycetota bacterium]
MLLCFASCGSIDIRHTSSSLDYLYPAGTSAQPPQDVDIEVPLRVGIAFAPRGGIPAKNSNANAWIHGSYDPLTEVQREVVRERLAAQLGTLDVVQSIELIPTFYLRDGGSFEQLDQLRSAFGIDVLVLLSYDQAQFSSSNTWSLTYLTVVGAWLVEGEDNQTFSYLDAVVLHIPSRALLFRAAGTSTIGSSETGVNTASTLREEATRGFELAAAQLGDNLIAAVHVFAEQAASGTVRGLGTPAIEVQAAPEYNGVAKFENGQYVGAYGTRELLVACMVAVLVALGARRRTRLLSAG